MSYSVYLADRVTRQTLPATTPNYTYGTMVRFDADSWDEDHPENLVVLPNPECRLDVTYNYRQFYLDTLGKDDLHTLHDMTGRDAAPLLLQAIARLGCETSDDYWEKTPGNAGAALRILLNYAMDQPDGVFIVA